MLFLTVICIALIGALVYTLRQNAEKEREWMRERQLLITRIQAPGVGVLDSLTEVDEEPSYEHFDEDELPG